MLFIAYTTRPALHLHSHSTALHCSTPLDYRLITVVGLLGSLVYTCPLTALQRTPLDYRLITVVSAKFEQAKSDLDAPTENAWLSLKLALHECADALLVDKQQPCKNWLSAKTMQLIAEKKSANHLWLRYRKE